MKLGIMQPYFFPYIGYFQLLHTVDKFVFYDDVNFIKRGWINRNRILAGNAPATITIPVKNASQNRKINETRISYDDNKWQKKLLATVHMNYRKAPFFSDVFPVFESVVLGKPPDIGSLAKHSVTAVMHYLGIDRDMRLTSSTYGNDHLKATDRIIDICKQENADIYVNPQGGQHLYSPKQFARNDIEPLFLIPGIDRYNQRREDFIAHLSIIDVLMFNDRDRVRTMLTSATLIPSPAHNGVIGD